MSAYVRNVYIKKIIILFVLQVKYLARGRRRVVQYNNIVSMYGRYLSPPPCDTISRPDGPVGEKKIISYEQTNGSVVAFLAYTTKVDVW